MGNKKPIYMLVSEDELELPLFVTDNIQELAARVGTTAASIYSAIAHSNRKGGKSKYKRVYVEE